MVLLFAYRNACDQLLPLLYSFEKKLNREYQCRVELTHKLFL